MYSGLFFQSERCELNRQIRADNRLLCRLKTELQKIAEAVKTSIPKIAKAMELIFSIFLISKNLVIHSSGA